MTAAKVAQSYKNSPEITNSSSKTKSTAKAEISKRVRSSASKEVHPRKGTHLTS